MEERECAVVIGAHAQVEVDHELNLIITLPRERAEANRLTTEDK